jgi:hypothetical protein
MANSRKVLYSLFQKTDGDVSMHNNRKYINPKFERIGARSFPRHEARVYYSRDLINFPETRVLRIVGSK